MSESRAAQRYAKSILTLAEDKGLLDTVAQDFTLIRDAIHQNRSFSLLLSSPIVHHIKKLTILQAIFKDKVSTLTYQFFTLLVKKNRESLLLDIASQFILLYQDKKGIVTATLTTAYAVDPKLSAEFEELVTKISGKEPLLKTQVDESLIGGFLLKIGDKQLDESVEGKLRNIQFKLLNQRS